MAKQLEQVRLELLSLALFRGLLADPVAAAFVRLLDSGGEPLPRRMEAWGDFVHRLYGAGGDWSRYLLEAALRDETRYVVLRGRGEAVPAVMEEALRLELAQLEAVSRITPEEAARGLGCPLPLPRWETSPQDFAAAFHRRMERIGQEGYGIFAGGHMFLLDQDRLTPVRNPDPVLPEQLTGYEEERAAVWANTVALVEGRPAANALLYGDSGTGKSTCVKAAANALRHLGLRLIELRKDQLDQIPSLIDRLGDNPLKFILFIDDLSFTGDSEGFSSLKAALEGSVSAKAPNMAIYATSNRRHLMRERFSQREGDDVHIRDTLEETGSLSERFGLTVTFLRPSRELYLSIAREYCRAFGVPFDQNTPARAEAFALRRGGRSARTAKQFAESLAAGPPDKKEDSQ